MRIKVEVFNGKPYSIHSYGFISYVSVFYIKGTEGYKLTLKEVFQKTYIE
jgi:hypothetical protein